MTQDTQTPMPEQPAPVVNPLLSRIQLPGEVHRLPSRGLFYTSGELSDDVQDGEVTIYPMTTIDEITIRSPDLLFNGQAVTQIMARCCPQIKNIGGILAKDVDFLLVALRMISYGDVHEMKYTHDCKDAKEHSYGVNMRGFLKNAKSIDPTTLSKNFSKKLSNGQTVNFRPMDFNAIVGMMQAADDANNSPQERTTKHLQTLTNMIISVDEVTDKRMIFEWLDNVPLTIATEIGSVVDKTTEWGPDLTIKDKCKDCGEVIVLAAPVNPITFFI